MKQRLFEFLYMCGFDKGTLEDIFLTFLICAILAISCSSLTGCAGFGLSGPATNAKTDSPVYEMTLSGQLDSNDFSGVAIGNADPHHTIVIKSNTDVDMFTVKTCHRSVDVTEAIKYNKLFGWIQPKRSFQFEYTQAPGIEDNGICPMELCSYSKTVGQLPVDCAMIFFHNPKFAMPTQNICNGSSGNASGTMACKSQMGLIERVQFPTTTFTAPTQLQSDGSQALIPGQCVGEFINAQQTIFQYQVPTTKCSVEFLERGNPPLKAILTVIPFNAHPYQ